jgi:Ca2+:H+ antiporter
MASTSPQVQVNGIQQQEEKQTQSSTSASPPTSSSTPTPEKLQNNGLLNLPLHAGDLPLSRELTPVEKIKRTLMVRPSGESGRSGIHPLHFLRITFRSSSWASRIVNVLWPVVPAAIAVRYAMPSNHLVVFILSYLAMVPCANLIGFAGQELSRKFPHVMGVVIETT